jgi:predicted nucleotidyltransferase
VKLQEQDRLEIIRAAESVGIRSVYIFGSVLDDTADPRDIDVAVKGVPPGVFFRFYGRLMRRLSKPVDVVDLDYPTEVTKLIARRAVKIYG